MASAPSTGNEHTERGERGSGARRATRRARTEPPERDERPNAPGSASAAGVAACSYCSSPAVSRCASSNIHILKWNVRGSSPRDRSAEVYFFSRNCRNLHHRSARDREASSPFEVTPRLRHFSTKARVNATSKLLLSEWPALTSPRVSPFRRIDEPPSAPQLRRE